jgi:hypothetical protein
MTEKTPEKVDLTAPSDNGKVPTKTLRCFAFNQDGSERVFEVTIPATWKVTFGPLAQGGPHVQCMALRIYETKEKQRACFINVMSFFDLDIPIKEQVDHTHENSARKSGAESALRRALESNEVKDEDGFPF